VLLTGQISSLHQHPLPNRPRRVPQRNLFFGKGTTVAFCAIEISVKEVVLEVEEMNANRIGGLDVIHKGS